MYDELFNGEPFPKYFFAKKYQEFLNAQNLQNQFHFSKPQKSNNPEYRPISFNTKTGVDVILAYLTKCNGTV